MIPPAAKSLKILLVEDSRDDAFFLIRELKNAGFAPLWARVAGREGLSTALKTSPWDIVVCDNAMPGFGGYEALSLVRASQPELPFYFFSGSKHPGEATQAFRKGASGFFKKDDTAGLISALRGELNGPPGPHAAAARTPAERRQAAGRDPAAPPRILIVDDRMENLAVLEALLDGVGARLVKAHSGEQALVRLLEGEFALVLLDVRMPGLNGFETAELIRSRERTRKVPIIFMTAMGDDAADVTRAYALGAVDYLSKPFPPEMLRSKVAVFLELYRQNRNLEQQAENVKALNGELRALASTVSDELRGPLRLLQTSGERLRAEYRAKPSGEEGAACVDRMERAAERVGLLVRNFLDYVALTHVEGESTRVDPGALMEGILAGLAGELERRNVRVRAEGPRVTARAYPPTLERTLSGLLSNALRTIRPEDDRDVIFRTERAGDKVRLSIEARGKELSSPAEELGKGAGSVSLTSLAVVNKAVERMEGRMGVELQPGVGSRVWIELPAVPA